MSRGNTCTHGDYEGLYYIDWDNFNFEFEDEDEDGNTFIDYDMQRWEFEDSLEIFKQDFKKKYKSFSDCDEWINRDEHAILESELFYITIEDNEWSIAVKLIQKEEPYYWNGSIEGLQKKHYQSYLNGIKKCLFNQFDTLGIYGGPWTCGTISKEQM